MGEHLLTEGMTKTVTFAGKHTSAGTADDSEKLHSIAHQKAGSISGGSSSPALFTVCRILVRVLVNVLNFRAS